MIDRAWRGRLSELMLAQPQLGEWRLQKAFELQLAADDVRASRLCMVQGDAQLCAEAAGMRLKG